MKINELNKNSECISEKNNKPFKIKKFTKIKSRVFSTTINWAEILKKSNAVNWLFEYKIIFYIVIYFYL